MEKTNKILTTISKVGAGVRFNFAGSTYTKINSNSFTCRTNVMNYEYKYMYITDSHQLCGIDKDATVVINTNKLYADEKDDFIYVCINSKYGGIFNRYVTTCLYDATKYNEDGRKKIQVWRNGCLLNDITPQSWNDQYIYLVFSEFGPNKIISLATKNKEEAIEEFKKYGTHVEAWLGNSKKRHINTVNDLKNF